MSGMLSLSGRPERLLRAVRRATRPAFGALNYAGSDSSIELTVFTNSSGPKGFCRNGLTFPASP